MRVAVRFSSIISHFSHVSLHMEENCNEKKEVKSRHFRRLRTQMRTDRDKKEDARVENLVSKASLFARTSIVSQNKTHERGRERAKRKPPFSRTFVSIDARRKEGDIQRSLVVPMCTESLLNSHTFAHMNVLVLSSFSLSLT